MTKNLAHNRRPTSSVLGGPLPAFWVSHFQRFGCPTSSVLGVPLPAFWVSQFSVLDVPLQLSKVSQFSVLSVPVQRNVQFSEFCMFGVPKIQQIPEDSMSLTKKIRGFSIFCQQELFPCVEQNHGALPKRFRKLLLFELVCVEDYLPRPRLRSVGRLLAHRVCLARSFLAKIALTIPTTSGLRERLLSDVLLRSLCGWSRSCDVPSAPMFSRAFQEFAAAKLPTRIHEALIKQGYAGELVGHFMGFNGD